MQVVSRLGGRHFAGDAQIRLDEFKQRCDSLRQLQATLDDLINNHRCLEEMSQQVQLYDLGKPIRSRQFGLAEGRSRNYRHLRDVRGDEWLTQLYGFGRPWNPRRLTMQTRNCCGSLWNFTAERFGWGSWSRTINCWVFVASWTGCASESVGAWRRCKVNEPTIAEPFSSVVVDGLLPRRPESELTRFATVEQLRRHTFIVGPAARPSGISGAGTR